MPTIVPLTENEIPSECLVYKHSTTCPVSATAASEVKALETPLTVYWVNVIEQRPLSNWIAEAFGVRHESPQLLFIKDGKVKQVWNHWHIKKDAVVTE